METAGEINDLVRDSLRYFHNIRPEDIAVTLIHSRDQILPEIGPNLREFARVKMQRAGVKILLNTRVMLATPEGIGLNGGDFIKGATTVCTIGSTMAPVVAGLSMAKEDGWAAFITKDLTGRKPMIATIHTRLGEQAAYAKQAIREKLLDHKAYFCK